MAQTTYTVLNPVGLSGTSMVNEYNADFAGVISMNSGPNAPAGPVAGMLWMKTGDSTMLPISIHDGGSGASAWIHTITLDPVNHWPRFAVDADHDTYISRTSTDGQIAFTIEGGTGAVFSAGGIGWGAAAPAGVAMDLSALRGVIRPPRGTTAQRPTSPQSGDAWYNTQLNRWERYTGSSWVEFGAGSGGGAATTLVALTDTSIANQSNGQVLVATGTNTWGNGQVSSSGLASDSVTRVKIADDAVGEDQIADRSVTRSKIATGAVYWGEIANNAVRSNHIADNAVGSSEIAANAVGASELNVSGNGSERPVPPLGRRRLHVMGEQVSAGGGGGGTPADGSITTAKLANGAVSTAKLANDAVTATPNSPTTPRSPPRILKVAGNGTAGQVLTSDGNGGFAWVTLTSTRAEAAECAPGTVNPPNNGTTMEFTGHTRLRPPHP